MDPKRQYGWRDEDIEARRREEWQRARAERERYDEEPDRFGDRGSSLGYSAEQRRYADERGFYAANRRYDREQDRYGDVRERDRYGEDRDRRAAWMWPVEPQSSRRDFDEPRSEALREERRASGAFVGRGPRGYKRSDERILDEVHDVLTRHPQIDASDVEVKVSDCSVTLRGSVPSRPQKWLAEEVAADIYGVSEVKNDLHVKSTGDTGMYGTAAYAVGIAYGTAPGTVGSLGSVGPMGRMEIRERMEVVGSDLKRVGSVKEVRSNDIFIDRPMAVDLYVPLSAVRSIQGDQIVLEVPSERIDTIAWTKAMEATGRASGTPTQSHKD